MRFLSLAEILELHRLVITQSGGSPGLREPGALDPPLPSLSLVMNHPFIDGNKRVGHAALETFLVLNGYEIDAPVDEQEDVILRLAAGQLGRAELVEWLGSRITPLE